MSRRPRRSSRPPGAAARLRRCLLRHRPPHRRAAASRRPAPRPPRRRPAPIRNPPLRPLTRQAIRAVVVVTTAPTADPGRAGPGRARPGRASPGRSVLYSPTWASATAFDGGRQATRPAQCPGRTPVIVGERIRLGGMSLPDRRILFVHAHPDDESIVTGATMAKYADEGALVTLVTCTLGEEGEVIPENLRYLASDKENRLGGYRARELAEACSALGVRDHRFLGGSGRWRDSGMMDAPTNDNPRCFWRADVDEAAAELVKIIREVRPHVMVTYDANGNYAHPDHVQAHRVARRAFELAGDPAHGEGEPWRVARFYATATPRTVLARSVAVMNSGECPFDTVSSVDEL